MKRVWWQLLLVVVLTSTLGAGLAYACGPDCPAKSESAAKTQAHGEPQPTSENTQTQPLAVYSESDLDTNPMRFYAYLDDRPKVTRGPLLEMLKDKPAFRFLYKNLAIARGARPTPTLQWFVFANKRIKFLPGLIFVLLTSAIAWTVCPDRLGRAQAECPRRFWTCFGNGIVCGLATIVLVRAFLLTGVGWPLAIATTAVLQLALVLGLATAVGLIGHSLVLVTRLKQLPALAERPRLVKALELVLGALVCAALLQIGAPHLLPRIGTRLVCLFAVLGMGALWRTRAGGHDATQNSANA